MSKPEGINYLFLTVWSTKIQQMFDVLQPGGPTSYNLLDSAAETTDYAACKAYYPEIITDRMMIRKNLIIKEAKSERTSYYRGVG